MQGTGAARERVRASSSGTGSARMAATMSSSRPGRGSSHTSARASAASTARGSSSLIVVPRRSVRSESPIGSRPGAWSAGGPGHAASRLWARPERDLTVPTGTPSCSAISSWVWPEQVRAPHDFALVRWQGIDRPANLEPLPRLLHRLAVDRHVDLGLVAAAGRAGLRAQRRRSRCGERSSTAMARSRARARTMAAARHALTNVCCTTSAASSRSWTIEIATVCTAPPYSR